MILNPKPETMHIQMHVPARAFRHFFLSRAVPKILPQLVSSFSILGSHLALLQSDDDEEDEDEDEDDRCCRCRVKVLACHHALFRCG